MAKEYEERHTIRCNQTTVQAVDVRDYLTSQGFGREIYYFNRSCGALVVRIPENRKTIVQTLQEKFGRGIEIRAEPLQSDTPLGH